MKLITSISLLLSLSACSVSNQTLESKVSNDVQQAVSNQDFHLYSLGGRVPNFPGIDSNEQDELVAKCGKRIMENTSDVIKREEDFKRLEIAFEYAKQYNKKMQKFCKQK